MPKCEICGKDTVKDNTVQGLDVMFVCDECAEMLSVEVDDQAA